MPCCRLEIFNIQIEAIPGHSLDIDEGDFVQAYLPRLNWL